MSMDITDHPHPHPPSQSTRRHTKRVSVALEDGWSVITHKAPKPTHEPRPPKPDKHHPPSKPKSEGPVEDGDTAATPQSKLKAKRKAKPKPKATDPTSQDVTNNGGVVDAPKGPSRRERRLQNQAQKLNKDGANSAFERLRRGEITPKEYTDECWRILREKGVPAPPTAMVEGLTVEKLLLDYERVRKVWEGCKGRAELLEMLMRGGEGREGGLGITEALCYGTGSFSLDWENSARAIWQLVLFLDVVGAVRKLPTPSSEPPSSIDTTPENDSTNVLGQIPLHAQDPVYTPLDIAFLSALSITVHPSSAETLITPTSFLYAPFIDWPILTLIVLPNADPALYIGNEIRDDMSPVTHTENMAYLEEANREAKKFLQGRRGQVIKGGGEVKEARGALEGLWCAWREGGEKGDEGKKEVEAAVEGVKELGIEA